MDTYIFDHILPIFHQFFHSRIITTTQSLPQLEVADIPIVGFCTPKTGAGTLRSQLLSLSQYPTLAVFANDATVAGATSGVLYLQPFDVTARIIGTGTRLVHDTAEVHDTPDHLPGHQRDPTEAVASRVAGNLKLVHRELRRWP